jgi:hypothetical protein
MGWWNDASRGAAFEFGARHYRAFGIFHALRWVLARIGWLLGGLAILAGLAALTWFVLQPLADDISISWPLVLRLAAAAVAVVVAAHFIWERVGYRAEARRAFTGREFSSITVIGIVAVVAMAGASFFLG